MTSSKADMIQSLRLQISEIETRQQDAVDKNRFSSRRAAAGSSARVFDSFADTAGGEISPGGRLSKGYRENGSEAFTRVVRLCSVRDRSVLELRKRLRDEEFDDEEIEAALTRAINCNLVNDMRFADARIRKLVHDNKGNVGIERDLTRFGISLCDVKGWPEEYVTTDNEAELKRAIRLLERRPSRSKNLLRGSYQKLISNGYTHDVAVRAARIWTSRQ